jgi:multidrug efflux pump subunit AcrA (membrane-fusion protein)
MIKKSFSKFWTGIKAHRILTAVIIITVVVGGYEIYTNAKTADAATQYVVSPASIGNIVQTVAGTGQITAANQIDITAQASGAITSITASVGQRVSTGDLIATIDPTNALSSLTNAKLSFAQLTEAPKPGDVVNDQNAVTKAYSDGFNSVAGAFTDMQTVMTGLNSMLYDQGGFLGTSNSSSLNLTDQTNRNTTGVSYDSTNAQYHTVLLEYQSLSAKSATSSVNQLITDTYAMLKNAAITLHDAQYAVSQIAVNEPTYHSNLLTSTESNIASWTGTIGNDVSSVGSAGNTITSSLNSLNTLLTGADPLQVQSSALSVAQAQQTYDNYFVRAPFAGVVGRIPVALYNQAGSGTVIATLISDLKIANISLDEVDAAKVKVGQPVTITFNAISGFTATGTVSEVDLVGTVSAGVVSYNVKIAVNTADPRILPGMSVNVSIITMEKDGVLIVPTSSIKTQSNRTYVQVLASSTVSAYLASQGLASGAGAGRTGGYGGRNASSTTGFASSTTGFASSTTGFASSTTGGYGGFNGSSGTGIARAARATVSLTIPSAIAPVNTVIVTGLADDTNTEIVSGLTPRSWIVTRTIAGGSASTAAPSILNTLTGGARTGAAGAGGGGAFRATGGGGAAGAIRIGG